MLKVTAKKSRLCCMKQTLQQKQLAPNDQLHTENNIFAVCYQNIKIKHLDKDLMHSHFIAITQQNFKSSLKKPELTF